jgi:hypothetical protein
MLINQNAMRTDELVVFLTYHLDNSRNIDVNTPKTKNKRKQNKKKKQVKKKQKKETRKQPEKKPSEQSGFYKTKKCMQCHIIALIRFLCEFYFIPKYDDK